MSKCLIEDCRKPAKNRGLCGACAKLAHKAVKSGSVTWAKLEELGLARPLKEPVFVAALAKREAQAKLLKRRRRPRLAMVGTSEPEATSPGGASTTSDTAAQDAGLASF